MVGALTAERHVFGTLLQFLFLKPLPFDLFTEGIQFIFSIFHSQLLLLLDRLAVNITENIKHNIIPPIQNKY